MARIPADTADDIGRIVLLLRAVVLAVTNLTAVLASLVLIVAQRSVQRGKLAELIALELVLAFWNGSSLENLISNSEKKPGDKSDLQSR